MKEHGEALSPRSRSAAAAPRANGGKLAAALQERQANLRHVDPASAAGGKAKLAAQGMAASSAVGQLLKQRFAKVQSSLPAHLKRAPTDGETGEIS